MNKKDFMKAMSMIDDDLMRDADAPVTGETTAYETSVSGVERYRRPAWQRAAATAATLLLVLGVGAAGTYYLTHRGAPAPDEEQIIAASTAETTQTTAVQTEAETSAEATTVPTRKRDKLAKTTVKDDAAKESTYTEPVTDPAEDEESPTVTTYQECSGAPLSAQTTVQTTAAPKGTQTTAQTTEIPVWTQFPQTTRIDPNWHPGIDPAEWDYDIFADLAKNSYSTPTCDGIPEYRLVAPDGTEYLINLSEQWVWRRTPDMIGKPVEPEESMLTPSQWYFLTKRGADIGMQADQYGGGYWWVEN
jgi:hypothetical protein